MHREKQNTDVYESKSAKSIMGIQEMIGTPDFCKNGVVSEFYDKEIPESWKKGLNRISNLSVGWDSYDGLPISEEILNVTKTLLVELYQRGMPLPHIMPGGDNTVQLEFDNLDFEIYIESPNSVEIEHSCHILNIGSDYSKLGHYIDNPNPGPKCN